MFQILVCTENACKRSLSEEVLRLFQHLIIVNDLADSVQAVPSGCLGLCRSKGVSVQIGGHLYTNVTIENAEHVFQEYVPHMRDTETS